MLPGPEHVRLGEVRKMMGWNGPLLTDSGGFRVKHGPLRQLTEDGTFKSHLDGMTSFAERSTEIQYLLDATITMDLTNAPHSRYQTSGGGPMAYRCAVNDPSGFQPHIGYGHWYCSGVFC